MLSNVVGINIQLIPLIKIDATIVQTSCVIPPPITIKVDFLLAPKDLSFSINLETVEKVLFFSFASIFIIFLQNIFL